MKSEEQSWKSSVEIDSELDNVQDDTGLGQLFALSQFWDNAVYIDSYRADPSWTELLVFSDYGNEIAEILNMTGNSEASADFYLALFKLFAYHSLFFNWIESDIKGIEALLQRELYEDRIILPYRFGRLLYNRFNDFYEGSRTEHLSAEEVIPLLSDTPKGVYQLNSFLTGPLGLIHSEEYRFLPPSLFLPLWHCSDTGCRTLHTVEFLSPNISLFEIEHRIQDLLKDKFGPPSEWLYTLTVRYLQRRELESKGLKYYDLPILIAECIIGSERTALLKSALECDTGKKLREVLSSPPRRKKTSLGPSEELANRLTPEEQLQLLLVLKDKFLVRLIDQLTESRAINVSVGQIRHTKQVLSSLSLSTNSELSRLGLRSTRENPIIALISMIHKGYAEKGLCGELEWRLHAPTGISLIEGLLHYIKEKEPAVAIRDLILTTQSVTEYVCQQLQLSIETIVRNEETSIDRILWKMGFDPPQYDDFSERFLSHLEQFNEVLLSTPPNQTEDDRERIRAAGVNLFVYVEKFLDMLISYNIWLLASDHFLETEFTFNLGEARKVVPKVLGDNLEYEDSFVSWNTNGENALGVLLRYLSESLNWLQSLESQDLEQYNRSEQDIPHFVGGLEIRFPFNHIVLWADSDFNELRAYREEYLSIVSLLQQANLASVRNGLDHMRDSVRFPKTDTMLACISRLREAYSLACIKRYLPEIFWLEKTKQNRFGIIDYHLKNSENRLLVLHGPPMFIGLRELDFERPYIIAPSNLLGGPNANLVFVLQEGTEYDNYWENYPRRRNIPRAPLGIEKE